MAEPARTLPSFEALYAEIVALREGLTGEILQPGVVRVMSRPGAAHRRAAKRILQALGSRDVGSGGTGWWIEVEAEVRFPGDRLAVPDLCGFRVERVPVLPDENPLTLLPDWCCEVLSPTTARDDRRLKLPLYAGCGVSYVWLLDPALRIVEVYETTPAGKPALVATAGEDEAVALAPFDDVVIDLAPFWMPEGS